MKGLDISILPISEVRKDNAKFRVDSAYFGKEIMRLDSRVRAFPAGFVELGDTARSFRKGIFDIKADSYTEIGVPLIRIGNLRGGIISETGIAYIDEEAHSREAKTEVQRGDLAISKTAYPAVSYVQLAKANVSQDIIAYRMSSGWSGGLRSGFLAAYLNSAAGIALMQRQFQGNVQLHLSLDDGRKVPVPLMGEQLQSAVEAAFLMVFDEIQLSESAHAQAELVLLEGLGLENWTPPMPLTYPCRATKAFAAGRLDAEHFQPRFEALRAHIKAKGAFRLGDIVSNPIRRGISPEYVKDGEIIVINSQHVGRAEIEMGYNRRTTSTVANRRNLHAKVQKNDVLLNSTGRVTIGRCQCLLDDINAIVDNHVAVIRPISGVDPVYLATFLNAWPGKWQTEAGWTGSSGQIELRPDVVADFVVWNAPAEIQSEVRAHVESARAARRRARQQLERAKSTVEVAIEHSEAEALAFLRTE